MSDTDISREDLKAKSFEEWTEAEKWAAKDYSHTLGVSLYNVRRLGQHGDKGQTWDDILGDVLNQLEEADE